MPAKSGMLATLLILLESPTICYKPLYGELAQQSGLSASRIRFYESANLIRSPRRQANGYREYPDNVLLVLQILRIAQEAGFSLKEIKGLLPTSSDKALAPGDMVRTLRLKIDQIRIQEQRLEQSRIRIQAIADRIDADPGCLSCASGNWVLAGLVGA